MPSDEKRAAIDVYVMALARGSQWPCAESLALLSLIEREKQLETKRETAEGLLEEVLNWGAATGSDRDLHGQRLRRAIALIRADKERVERAIAVLAEYPHTNARADALSILEGREP